MFRRSRPTCTIFRRRSSRSGLSTRCLTTRCSCTRAGAPLRIRPNWPSTLVAYTGSPGFPYALANRVNQRMIDFLKKGIAASSPNPGEHPRTSTIGAAPIP